jgi:PAT family beta-lactamase induction signal transducer AmpG
MTALNYYLDPRCLRIFLLGCISGLPWVMIGSVLTLWLKDAGLSRASIGYAGLIFAAYSVNFLWSPLLDHFRWPLLSKLGQRKSWLLLTQIVIIAGCVLASQTNPVVEPNLTILYCLIIAFGSATADIAIDAYRIESIPEKNSALMSAGAAMATSGWWTGFAGMGAVALWAQDTLLHNWPSIYWLLAMLVVVLTAVMLGFPERQKESALVRSTNSNYIGAVMQLNRARKLLSLLLLIAPFVLALWALLGSAGLPQHFVASAFYIPALLTIALLSLCGGIVILAQSSATASNLIHTHNASALDRLLATLGATVISPLEAFFSRNGMRLALQILAFVVLFKIGEAFLGRMSLVFYKEVGFSNSDIAAYSKLGSWLVTIVFSLISGWFTIRYGIVRGLLIAGVAMASSNLMFAIMALAGPIKWVFAITIIVDGFTSAWSNVAFVAFLSSLCDRAYTATQYALLASLGTLGRTLFASSSGQMVDGLGGNWAMFFSITAVMVLPALWLLYRCAAELSQRYALDAESTQ